METVLFMMYVLMIAVVLLFIAEVCINYYFKKKLEYIAFVTKSAAEVLENYKKSGQIG